MPRAGGVFSLVASYFATSGTPITVSQHNPVLEDIAQGLTESLPRDGSAAMSGTLQMGNSKVTGLNLGSAALPTLAFNGDANTGIFSPGADQVAISTGGVARLTVDASGGVALGAGTALLPTLTTTGDLNTGIYFPAANRIAITTDGVQRLRVDDTGDVNVFGIFSVGAGTEALPALTTTGDANTGIYFPADNRVAISTAGTQRLRVDDAGAVVVLGTLELADGTASLPSLTKSGDTDTGVYFPTTNQVGVTTGGTETARFVSDAIRVNTSVSDPGVGNTTNGLALRTDGSINSHGTSQQMFSFSRGGTDGVIGSFRKGGTAVGSISVTGSATTYNTSSDYRLKYDMPWDETYDPVGMIKALADAQRFYGFYNDLQVVEVGWYAHELAEIVPSAVTGEKDGPEMQGRDDSKLIVHLVAALADALKRIEALEAVA